MDFWERIKLRIREENTTQNWVAERAKVSRRTFTGWISKGIMPRVDQAVSIAQALGVSVEYLVTGEDTYYFSKLTPEQRECVEMLFPLNITQTVEVKGIVRNYIQRNFEKKDSDLREKEIG